MRKKDPPRNNSWPPPQKRISTNIWCHKCPFPLTREKTGPPKLFLPRIWGALISEGGARPRRWGPPQLWVYFYPWDPLWCFAKLGITPPGAPEGPNFIGRASTPEGIFGLGCPALVTLTTREPQPDQVKFHIRIGNSGIPHFRPFREIRALLGALIRKKP